MELHALMKKFAGLAGHATIGCGPKHPVTPCPELQADIDEFMREYPFVARDSGYVQFLETYSAAVYTSPNEELAVDIFGFSEFTLHLLYPDESPIEQERFYIFAETSLEEGDSAKGLLFAWDITGGTEARHLSQR